MRRFDIITIFPKIFDSYFNESIIKRAREKKLVDIRVHDLRKFSRDKHKKVDDRPYGGGAGMVIQAVPVLCAVSALKIKNKNSPPRRIHGLRPSKAKQFASDSKIKIIVLSAKGQQFTQKMAYKWSKKYKNIVLISGRYEGIDERVTKILKAEEISVGPYITTDGDVAAMVIISALTRLIPNVINWTSLEDESFLRKLISREAKIGELEYPHYTRPEVLEWRGKQYVVPKVLLSGDHKKIEEWRKHGRKKPAR